MPQLEFVVRRCAPSYSEYLSCLPPTSKQHQDELEATYAPHYDSPNHLSEVREGHALRSACVVSVSVFLLVCLLLTSKQHQASELEAT